LFRKNFHFFEIQIFSFQKQKQFYSTKATGQHITVLTDFITTTNPTRTIHPLLLAEKIPSTYSKPQVRRFLSQIPQRDFPRCRSSQQGKAWTSLYICFSLVTAD